ncbi:hypothetical protein [Hydrogenophaga sp. T2]|uniref:hypothetical protein n=1 Tax=Hydrogenophaga sp. T2 TaxID=3132823 RepID=UPI003CF675ED
MAAVEPRVLTLQIDKIQSGLYRAELQWKGDALGEAVVYSRIGEAILAETESVHADFAQFVEVRYHELSSGTIPLSLVSGQAEEIAERLVGLMHEMRLIAGG